MGYKSQADTELDVADYALEEWAKWALSNNGYGASPSLKIMLDVRKNYTYPALPHGVEASYEVIDSNFVFAIMKEGGSRNRIDAAIVQAVAIVRSKNQSLTSLVCSKEFKDVLSRFIEDFGCDQLEVTRKDLYDARLNFARRYSTLKILR